MLYTYCRPVWIDGEHTRRTPVSIEVVPSALTIGGPSGMIAFIDSNR